MENVLRPSLIDDLLFKVKNVKGVKLNKNRIERIDFMEERIQEQENYVDELVNKAVVTGALTVDEMEIIELDDIHEETQFLGQDESDNLWKITLENGKEIEIRII